MTAANRPLSPHLQIYRWEITMFLSILHRITGFGLAVGAALLTWWLLSAVNGGYPYNHFIEFTRSPWGKLMMFGWMFSFVFHFINGLRHLLWDTGLGITIKFAKWSGWFVLFSSIALTALLWRYAG